MEDNSLRIADESIELELNLAKLYTNFSHIFQKDSNFWWNLSLEEKNHAAMLKSVREYFMPADVYPPEILSSKLQPLVETNQMLEKLLKDHKDAPPSRESAFNLYLCMNCDGR